MMMFVVVAVAVLAITCGGCLVAVVVLWRKVKDLTVYNAQLEEGIARAFGQHDDGGQVEQRPRLRVVRGGGRYLAGVALVGWLRDHPALASSAAGVVATAAVTSPFMLTPDTSPPASMPERLPEASTTMAPPASSRPSAPRVSKPPPAPAPDDRSNGREPQPAADGDEAEPSPRPAPVEVKATTPTTTPAPEPADEVLPPVQAPRLPPADDERHDDCAVEVLGCVEVRVELDVAA